MEKQEMKQIVLEMIAAPSCCQELKDAAQKWLEAADPAAKKAAADALVLELKDDVAPIGHVIEFFESPLGKQKFGEERAAAMAAHAREVQAKGGQVVRLPRLQRRTEDPRQCRSARLSGMVSNAPCSRGAFFSMFCRWGISAHGLFPALGR